MAFEKNLEQITDNFFAYRTQEIKCYILKLSKLYYCFRNSHHEILNYVSIYII